MMATLLSDREHMNPPEASRCLHCINGRVVLFYSCKACEANGKHPQWQEDELQYPHDILPCWHVAHGNLITHSIPCPVCNASDTRPVDGASNEVAANTQRAFGGLCLADGGGDGVEV